ncbi:hypothetical protein D3C87_1567500 [compost metagenome]
MVPTLGAEISVCGRTNSCARARALMRVRNDCENALASGCCRAERATRADTTAKMFLIRWLSSWLTSSLPRSICFRSSMSVQVPNQRTISPSSSRTAVARPRVQR